MKQINEGLSVKNYNTNNVAVSLHSVVEDVNKNRCINEKRSISSLYSSAFMKYQKLIENNRIEEKKDLCRRFFAVPKNLKNEHENYTSSLVKYQKEEKKNVREIMQLEKKLKSGLLKNEGTSKEVADLKKEVVVTKEALSVAKKYYSSVWDMHIDITESKEESFTCEVHLKLNCEKYPIEFVIDRKTQIIIDWSCSSMLSKEEEAKIKEKTCRTNYYFPKVLLELRSLVLTYTRTS